MTMPPISVPSTTMIIGSISEESDSTASSTSCSKKSAKVLQPREQLDLAHEAHLGNAAARIDVQDLDRHTPVVAEVVRSGFVESVHHGHLVVLGAPERGADAAHHLVVAAHRAPNERVGNALICDAHTEAAGKLDLQRALFCALEVQVRAVEGDVVPADVHHGLEEASLLGGPLLVLDVRQEVVLRGNDRVLAENGVAVLAVVHVAGQRGFVGTMVLGRPRRYARLRSSDARTTWATCRTTGSSSRTMSARWS